VTAAAFRFAESVDDATALLRAYGEDARVVCGGTALAILLRQELIAPALLVGIGRIPELGGIAVDARGALRLGAAVSVRTAERDPRVAPWTALAEALAHVATPRIRNMATIGGGIAHADPAQDPLVALTALDAQVEIVGVRRRTVALAALLTGYYETALAPDELIVAVTVPPLAAGTGSAYLKFLPRSVEDYGTVTAAARIALDANGAIADAALVLGAVGATPVAVPVAAALAGRAPSAPALAAAAEAARDRVDPLTDVRGSAEYKRDMAVVIGRRALAAAAQRSRALTTPSA
jgi:carbon-monoxide dehydrogenase medium subunit